MNERTRSTKSPDANEIRAAAGKGIPDLIAPGLDVLFCGINPGLYSAAVSRHFARPGNRFWPALYQSGFTPRLMSPHESSELLNFGLGITTLVRRATASARELTSSELIDGGRKLARKVASRNPRWVAMLGISAYRTAFGCRGAVNGLQSDEIGGARLWVLPSPSGANGSYPLVDLVKQFRTFHDAVASSLQTPAT
jgi:TDG/mug DNA glycosylase family protein